MTSIFRKDPANRRVDVPKQAVNKDTKWSSVFMIKLQAIDMGFACFSSASHTFKTPMGRINSITRIAKDIAGLSIVNNAFDNGKKHICTRYAPFTRKSRIIET